MVLADTSIWVDHLRQGNARLAQLLEEAEVACHPFVIGELACGNLRNRGQLLEHLSALPSLPKAQENEVLEFIELHGLMGRGLGLIDIHLLASCSIASTKLWTRDKWLAQTALELGLI